jgi:cation diffusion facilitator family transporter
MKKVYKTIVVSMIVNTLLVTFKLIFGLITNYKSIVADAIHSFSDLSTDFVALAGQKLSFKNADGNHPYGHGRIEYITSIVIGAVIMALGIELIYSTISSKTVVSHNWILALIVVFITIVGKYILAKYVSGKGKKMKNAILIASGKESMADVFSSIGVFIAIVLSLFKDEIPIFEYADKCGGFIISLFIIKTAFSILKDNINAIIGECEQDEEVIYKIKGLIMSVPEVLGIDNLSVMKFGSYYQIILDAGVDADCKLEKAHTIAHNIEHELIDSDLTIKYVSVHINPYEKKKSVAEN